MKYLYKNKKVKIDFDKKDGVLLVMDEAGNKIIDKFINCILQSISANGIQFIGFTMPLNNKSNYRDLFFGYEN